jgi:hypothetical protein
MNAHSTGLMESYPAMLVHVRDGIFNRAVCKKHGNYSGGCNFQNCFERNGLSVK